MFMLFLKEKKPKKNKRFCPNIMSSILNTCLISISTASALPLTSGQTQGRASPRCSQMTPLRLDGPPAVRPRATCAHLELNVVSMIAALMWRLPHNRTEVFAFNETNGIKGGELTVCRPRCGAD